MKNRMKVLLHSLCLATVVIGTVIDFANAADQRDGEIAALAGSWDVAGVFEEVKGAPRLVRMLKGKPSPLLLKWAEVISRTDAESGLRKSSRIYVLAVERVEDIHRDGEFFSSIVVKSAKLLDGDLAIKSLKGDYISVGEIESFLQDKRTPKGVEGAIEK